VRLDTADLIARRSVKCPIRRSHPPRSRLKAFAQNMYSIAKQRSREGEELRAEGWRYRSVLTLLDVRQPDAQYPGLGTLVSLRPYLVGSWQEY
jgi:hypothetical protein